MAYPVFQGKVGTPLERIECHKCHDKVYITKLNYRTGYIHLPKILDHVGGPNSEEVHSSKFDKSCIRIV